MFHIYRCLSFFGRFKDGSKISLQKMRQEYWKNLRKHESAGVFKLSIFNWLDSPPDQGSILGREMSVSGSLLQYYRMVKPLYLHLSPPITGKMWEV